MKILVSGGSGLVGSALVSALGAQGYSVFKLVRKEVKADNEIKWEPAFGNINREQLEGFDAVVHLAGENIASGRWTDEKKSRIRDSRVKGTRLLAETLAALSNKPQVFISASAIGFYGDRGNEIMKEESPMGAGFLASVCREWEQASLAADKAGIRTIQLRTGVVLSKEGGALSKMLPAFEKGLGGPLGSGKQYMSWIAVTDLAGIIIHALTTPDLRGPVNAVSPNPVENKEFTKTLGKVLHRPALLPVPDFALGLLLGQMADELLISSTRVDPCKLLNTHYHFAYPQLEEALKHELGRN